MSTEDGKKPTIDPSRLDLSLGDGQTSSVEAGGVPSTVSSAAVTMDFNADGTTERPGIGELDDDAKEKEAPEGTKEAVEGEAEKTAEGDGEKAETTEEGSETAYEPLPDYTPETVAAYDERFIKVDGESQELNIEAIADEIRANMAKPEGERTERPNEGTYKYLKDKLGLPASVIDNHIEGEKLKHERNLAAYNEVTGGPEAWAAKLAWAGKQADGTPGGYTKAQVDAFNAGIKAGGQAAAEQIELMNARAEKAGVKLPEVKKTVEAEKTPATIGLQKPRRAASPAQTAAAGGTTNSGGVAAKPFANAEEHRAAMAEVRTLPRGEQDAAVTKLRARLVVSPWWSKGNQKK